jgi:hypothetical protein
MSAFEYVTVLISIILGLGITQILTGIADLIHQSNRVKVYWPHVLWVFIVLVLHVQEWWVTFELKDFQPWRLPTFLFVMLYPIILFVLARLLFPFGIQEGRVDLKVFYYDNYRKIFLFGSTLPILSILDGIFIRDIDLSSQIVKLVLPVLLLLICIRKKETPGWGHQLIAVIFLAILIATIAVQWNEWLISN